MKTALDSVKKSKTAETLAGAYSAIDKAVKGKLLHKNTAARLKSQVGRKTA